MPEDIYSSVHASTQNASCSRGNLSSYNCSTRLNGVSLRTVNVFRGIVIAIMLNATLWANPLGATPSELAQSVAAMTATLTTREEPINYNKLLPIPLTFVGEHLSEHSESSLSYRSSDFTFLSEHASKAQVLNGNSVVFSHKFGCQLVHAVLLTVTDMLVDTSYFSGRHLPSIAADLFPRNAFGGKSQFPQILSKKSRIWNTLTIGKCCQSIDSHVYSNRLSGFRKWFNNLFAQEGGKVFTGRLLDYSYNRGSAFQTPAPRDFDFSYKSYMEFFVIANLKSGSCQVSGLSSMLGVKFGILSLFIPESYEGNVQPSQGHLKSYRGHLGKPHSFFFFFPDREKFRCVKKTNPLFFIKPRISPNSERSVVNKTTAPKQLGQALFLLLGWVNPESPPNIHTTTILPVKQLSI